jgi:predicted metal-dependent phosphoesterase TrpH
MEKCIDLHTHSTFSDGTYTPEEIMAEASKLNLKAVALTDHDTAEGIERFKKAGEKYGVEAIGGIELAAYYNFLGQKKEIHIVGLFVDNSNSYLIEKTKQIREERLLRNKKMIEKLSSIGFPMTFEELNEFSHNGNITRAHYARLMVKKGYISTVKEAFQKYISSGMPGFVPRNLISPKEAFDIISKSGGVPILAHPTLYGMDYHNIRNMVRELKEIGLKGIEVMYSTYKSEQEREITRIATEEGLLFSGGSDFHGLNKKDIFLGTGKGNLKIPYSFLEKIKEERN